MVLLFTIVASFYNWSQIKSHQIIWNALHENNGEKEQETGSLRYEKNLLEYLVVTFLKRTLH